MAYITREARQQLLDSVAEAIEHLGLSLAALGTAYEQLDERTADRLEDDLFGPVQRAYGRARRAHSGFAQRHGLPARTFEPVAPRAASHGVAGLVGMAVEAVADADDTLAELQDSMMPVEVGDPELRAGLAEVREALGDVAERARAFMRVLGR
jgi:hypothetical protein